MVWLEDQIVLMLLSSTPALPRGTLTSRASHPLDGAFAYVWHAVIEHPASDGDMLSRREKLSEYGTVGTFVQELSQVRAQAMSTFVSHIFSSPSQPWPCPFSS